MNLQEAHSILELSPGVTPEDAKKKYRELTKKFHPDVNKDPGAEDKFKKINEAYQCVSNGKGTDREERLPNMHNNPFSHFTRQQTIHVEHISLNTTISFQESVLGCKKDFKFYRRGKCINCQGQGEIHLNNNCNKCHGRGQIIERQDNMIMARTCDQCFGKKPVIPCSVCQTNGFLETEVSVNVTIPGGIQHNNILRLGGMGHYVGSFMNMDQFSDAHLQIQVIPENGLSLDGIDVISTIDISLLEALQGVSKNVTTIIGEKYIFIPGLTKNKDEIVIPKLGVNGTGSHRVIVNVNYPLDITNLLGVLEDKIITDSGEEI